MADMTRRFLHDNRRERIDKNIKIMLQYIVDNIDIS